MEIFVSLPLFVVFSYLSNYLTEILQISQVSTPVAQLVERSHHICSTPLHCQWLIVSIIKG